MATSASSVDSNLSHAVWIQYDEKISSIPVLQLKRHRIDGQEKSDDTPSYVEALWRCCEITYACLLFATGISLFPLPRCLVVKVSSRGREYHGSISIAAKKRMQVPKE